MGFFVGLFLGVVIGVGLVMAFAHSENARSKRRGELVRVLFLCLIWNQVGTVWVIFCIHQMN